MRRYIQIPMESDLLNIGEYYNGKNGKFWVAVNEKNEIVGHIGLDASSIDKNGSVELRRCSVAAKCQKLGIGRLLVDHFLDKAFHEFKAKQIFLITTNMQMPAIRLYEKCKFRITEYNLMRILFNIRVLKMEKYLN
jgi:putative acetyltransferase